MAWQSNDKDLINAALQAAVNKNQAGIRQAQSGNRFQNLLSIAAMAANQNANPNSEMGRIMGGASNTYLNNLVSRNQGDFRSAVTAIHQNPNLGPQDKMTALMGTLSYYGQDPKDYSDILDAYSKQIQYQNQNAPVPLLNPQGQPVVDPNTGQPTMVPKGAKIQRPSQPKMPTQAQETTALYASRIKQANDVMQSMEDYINNLPVVGTALNQAAPNWLKSGKYQSYLQAQRNFLNAVLRRESGAVISPTEFAEGRQQYFPQPGDKPEVIAQKKANRDLVMQNFITASRDAYVPYQQSDPRGNQAGSDNDPLGVL